MPTPHGSGGVSFPEPPAGVDRPLYEQAEDTCLGVNDELHMADMGQDWGNFSDLDWLLPFAFGNLGHNVSRDIVSPEEFDLTPGLSSLDSARSPRANRERPINE